MLYMSGNRLQALSPNNEYACIGNNTKMEVVTAFITIWQKDNSWSNLFCRKEWDNNE